MTTFFRGWPNRSYQIQLRDMHQPSQFLPLGQIYRHGMEDGETHYDEELVSSLYLGTGEWHTLVIEVVREQLAVTFQGELVTHAEGIGNPSGFIGFQGEEGMVEYRAIRLRELD
jgi:hypothetical protein